MSDLLADAELHIKDGYAKVGEVTLHYVQCGDGERLAILLHGFPQCWYSWRHQLKSLGKGFTVVAPDMRGYNLSDKPNSKEHYRIEHLVKDVIGLIDHFGRRDAAIIGHDWGAGVAWATALLEPERVWKLAALQVPPLKVWRKNLSLKQALRSWYMAFFQLPFIPELWISALDFYGLERTFRTTSRPGTFNDTDIAIYKEALRQQGALTAAINYYRANVLSLFLKGSENSGAREGRIKCPTLFIYGERDFAIVPETVRGVSRVIDAPYRELRIPDSNHWVNEEFPVEVNSALIDFLTA
jgi:pimeloyl-ACP methyl ester carboxylesterase